jgi:SOS-response transcriptional repressor LexA
MVRSQKDCNNQEIIAAMIDGEATVKSFERKKPVKSGYCLRIRTLNQPMAMTAKSSAR